jgi:hypothetical protein
VLSLLGVLGGRGRAWSEAAEALRPAEGPIVVEEPGGRVVLEHYLGRSVAAVPPAAGAEYWRVSVDRDHGAVVERIEAGSVTPR